MNYQYNFWNNYFKYYDILLKVIPYQNLMKSLASSLSLSKGEKLLDLGSGTGNILYHIGKDVEHTGLDYSKEALARLKSKFPNSKTVYHSIKERLPFEDNTFDKLVSNNVMYTLESSEWDSTLAEIKRVVKPGGLVVISNVNSKFNAMNIYKGHIQQSIKSVGYYKTLASLIRLVYPTIKMINYNRVINEQNDKEYYSFLEDDFQVKVFEKQGFEKVSETQVVYADQAYLDVFRNVKG